MPVRIKTLLLCSLLVLALPNTANATNGSFLIGVGPKHRALGGAGVALPLDSTSIAINPASASHIDTTARIDAGAMLFYPKRLACTQAIPECERSGANLFLLPFGGGVYKFNRKVAFGFAATPLGGGNTRYGRDIFIDGGPPNTVGVDLKQMLMAPTVSYQANKLFTMGMSPLIGVQQFRAYGLDSLVTPGITDDPDAVTNNGNDYSYGAGVRLGTLVQFYKGRLNLGASYSSKVNMTEFDKYRGLFTPNGDFDIPSNWTIGIAVKPTQKLTLAFDVKWIRYKDVPAISNSINNTVGTANDPTTKGKLGSNDGGGFGWDDMTVYMIGLNYEFNDKLTLRAGFNYGESPIPDDDNLVVNTVAPATVEKHATVGFTYQFNSASEISVSYTHAFKNTQSNFDTGDFPISPGGGARIQMVQNAIDVSYGHRF